MDIEKTKIGKHFDVGFYRFIWFAITILFGAGFIWATLIGSVKLNTEAIKDCKVIFSNHIVDNERHLNTNIAVTTATIAQQVIGNTTKNVKQDTDIHELDRESIRINTNQKELIKKVDAIGLDIKEILKRLPKE